VRGGHTFKGENSMCESVIKECIVTRYAASDGKLFSDKQSAIEYEQNKAFRIFLTKAVSKGMFVNTNDGWLNYLILLNKELETIY